MLSKYGLDYHNKFAVTIIAKFFLEFPSQKLGSSFYNNFSEISFSLNRNPRSIDIVKETYSGLKTRQQYEIKD